MGDKRVYIMDVYNRHIYPGDRFAKRKLLLCAWPDVPLAWLTAPPPHTHTRPTLAYMLGLAEASPFVLHPQGVVAVIPISQRTTSQPSLDPNHLPSGPACGSLGEG